MPNRPVRVVVLADFNAANFAALLSAGDGMPLVEARAMSFDTFESDAPASNAGTSDDEVAIVWTRPDTTSAACAVLAQGGVASSSDALADVDAFAQRIDRLRHRCSRIIVMTWTPPRVSAAFGSMAMAENGGLSNVVMRMNLRLAERAAGLPGVVLLDGAAWTTGSRTPAEAKLWYAAKIPFSNEVFRRAALQVKSTLRAWRGDVKKLLIVDLDDTLWGGVVGDAGWQGIRLGGHDATGEAFVDFQRTVLALRQRGILLAIASKNDGTVACDAIDRHPEMILRREHFSAWRINWNDKAANIAAIADELNLGLSSVVFLDDNPSERGRVREALPEVLVPDWPSSAMLYSDALLGLGCFDTVALTDEDRSRAAMYAQETARSADRDAAGADDWLRRLELKVDVDEANERNLPRVVQLLNKTNQMNLSTRRVDAVELTGWLASGPRQLWAFRVRDRFGDAGLTGVTSVELNGAQARLVDFVLSCRVFGRRIENAMLHVAIQWARDHGAETFVAPFRLTTKNNPCRQFFQTSGFQEDPANWFSWDVATPYPPPADLVLSREMQLTR